MNIFTFHTLTKSIFSCSEQSTCMQDLICQGQYIYKGCDPQPWIHYSLWILRSPHPDSLSVMILPHPTPIVSPSYFRRVRPCSGLWPQWLSQSGSGPVFFPRIQSRRTQFGGCSGIWNSGGRRGGARIKEDEEEPLQMGPGVPGDPLPGLRTTEKPQQRGERGAGGGVQQVIINTLLFLSYSNLL